MSEEFRPMKTVRGPLSPDELMRLGCLVPKEGRGGVSCHEKTFCDCEVLALNDALVAARDGNALILEALEDTIGERDAALGKLEMFENRRKLAHSLRAESPQVAAFVEAIGAEMDKIDASPLRSDVGGSGNKTEPPLQESWHRDEAPPVEDTPATSELNKGDSK